MKPPAQPVQIDTRIGAVTPTWEDYWATGTTLYTVTATRVSGVLAITLPAPHPYNDDPEPLDPWTPAVRVEPGRPVAAGYLERTDPLTVNGIPLAGVTVLDVPGIAASAAKALHEEYPHLDLESLVSTFTTSAAVEAIAIHYASGLRTGSTPVEAARNTGIWLIGAWADARRAA